MPLTDVKIRNAKPKDKPFKLTDGGGLFLIVRPQGGKWWRYRYNYLGKEKLLALGIYPDIDLAEARRRHAEARKAVAMGNDPGELKRVAKQVALLVADNAFEVIAREWHKKRLPSWTTNHGDQILRRMEADVFPKLGTRPIANITAKDVLAMARTIEERGATDIAHRAVQMTSQVFAYAIITGRANNNPARDLKGALAPLRKKHHAYLKEAELPEFLQKLENYAGEVHTKLALKLLLLTYVRTSELREGVWTEIDFDKAEWRIPAERMKMRAPHIVPLSRQAIAVLRELELHASGRNEVFPNIQRQKGCMSQNTLLYALYRMGYYSRATGHGFRATASTILNENGFSSDVIERQLAHAERNGVRAAYNHAEYLPDRRKMMQWWGDYLDGALLKKKQLR